jgi:conjugative transfer signal peptidase TraF
MNSRFKGFTAGVAIGGAGMLLLGFGCSLAGARVNTTKSIPMGLYWTSSKPIEKGAYVQFCPPQVGVFAEAKKRGYINAGFCPGDYGYMMKRVLAAKDDVVAVDADGVRVNGALLPLSKPRKADKSDRPMPRYQASRYILTKTQLLLMSDVSGTSFDSRYFGPISQSQVVSVIAPVFTW